MAAETTRTDSLDNKNIPASLQGQEVTFLAEIRRGSKRNLLAPFGIPDPLKIAIVVVLTIAAILFFTRIINPGIATLNWRISFDVNIMLAVLIVIIGALTYGPRIARKPESLRHSGVYAPLVLLGLVALYSLSRFTNFGVFEYTQDKIDLSAIIGLVFFGALVALGLTNNRLAWVSAAGFVLWWGFSIGENGQDFGIKTFNDLITSENGGRLVRALTPPRWDYFTNVIDPMFLTVQIAIAASLMAIIVSLPLGMLAARNTTPHPIVYTAVRFLINTVRSIPSLIVALLFIPFVGLGPAAGIFGLAIHSTSVLTKLYAEAFEAVKPQPAEAMRAVGADGFKTFRWGVFPQAFPLIISYSFFDFESNTRNATVVAFAGGGGIGLLLQANINLLNYANVMVMIVVLVVTVSVLDRASDFIRSKII